MLAHGVTYATRRGTFAHPTNKGAIAKLRRAGAMPRQLAAHHWRLLEDPKLDWWPSRGKFQLQGSDVLMGDFEALCGLVTQHRPIETRFCALCSKPVREPGRKHHDDCLMRASYGDAAAPYMKGRAHV